MVFVLRSVNRQTYICSYGQNLNIPLIIVYANTRAFGDTVRFIFACDYVLLVYKDLFRRACLVVSCLVVSLMCNLNMGLNEFRLNCNSS